MNNVGAARGRHGLRFITPAAMGIVGGIYIWLAFASLPTGAYWSPDNGEARIQVDNIRLLPKVDLAVDYPGQWIDRDLKFVPFGPVGFYFIRNGHIYFTKFPILSILSKPFVTLMGDRGGLVLPLVSGVVSLFMVVRLIQKFDLGPAWAGILLAGLATPVLIYSLTFWEHSLAMAMGLGALVLVAESSHSVSLRNLIASGLLAGMAGIVRHEMMLFALALGWAIGSRPCGFRKPWAALWTASCAAPLGLYVTGNYISSGSLMPPHISEGLAPQFSQDSYLIVHGLNSISDFIFDPGYGAVGDLLVVALCAHWLASRGPYTLARGAIQVLALTAVGAGTLHFLISQPPTGGLKGILSVSPFLALATASFPTLSKDAQNLRFVAFVFYVLSTLSIGLLTPLGPDKEGLEWGTRFALIVFPLAVPLTLEGLGNLWEQTARFWLARLHLLVAFALVGLSAIIQFRGVYQMRVILIANLERKMGILALPEKQVVTDLWWISMVAPELYQAKDMFLLQTSNDFYEWVRAADSAGVRQFVYVSYAPLDAAHLVSAAPPSAQLSVSKTRRLGDGLLLMQLRIVPDGNPAGAPAGRFTVRRVVAGLNHPDYVTHAGDGSGRLFVLEQPGLIRIVKNGRLSAEPFLLRLEILPAT